MTTLQRAQAVALAVLQTAAAVFMIIDPDDGFYVIAAIMSISLLLLGVRLIWYYFTLAIHMVGGRKMFYFGVLLLDFGMFVLSLGDIPRIWVLLYLLVTHAFSGMVELLRIREARHSGGRVSKLLLTLGIANILTALLCIVFIRSTRAAVYIYSAGLIYGAVIRIINAVRETRIIFIE